MLTSDGQHLLAHAVVLASCGEKLKKLMEQAKVRNCKDGCRFPPEVEGELPAISPDTGGGFIDVWISHVSAVKSH